MIEQSLIWSASNQTDLPSTTSTTISEDSWLYDHYAERLRLVMERHSMASCIIGWTMLAFSLFGVLSNALSLSIFAHASMRYVPVNILLAGLSLVDMLLSICVVPVFALPSLNLYYRCRWFDQVAPYVTLSLYPLTLMMQTCSVWLFVVITLERWSAVCRPLQARRYSSVCNARRALFSVCLCAILYNLVRFGEFNLITRISDNNQQNNNHQHQEEDQSHQIVLVELEPRLRNNPTYMFLYYFGLYLLTHFIGPFTVLFTVNTHMLCVILRARSQRRRLTNHERREHRIALMAFVVVLTFVLCNTMPFVMNLLEAFHQNYFRNLDTFFGVHLSNDIGNLLVMINSSATTFIYYAFSQRYRQRVHLLRLKLCTPNHMRYDEKIVALNGKKSSIVSLASCGGGITVGGGGGGAVEAGDLITANISNSNCCSKNAEGDKDRDQNRSGNLTPDLFITRHATNITMISGAGTPVNFLVTSRSPSRYSNTSSRKYYFN